MWARVTDPRGINDELALVLAMRMPRSVRGRSIDEVPVGVRLGRAPLLLFGVLPVEFDDLTVAAVDPGRRFHEKSSMVLLRRWEHEREPQPLPSGGTRIHDRLTFELRAPLSRVPMPPPWRTAWSRDCWLTDIAGLLAISAGSRGYFETPVLDTGFGTSVAPVAR